jgi:AhpD family alkylhydroperoxidase
MSRNYPEHRRELQMSLKRLSAQTPDMMKSVGALHGVAYKSGAMEAKNKELIALGISISVRCDDCIAFHTHEALAHGATREEVVECLNVAMQMGGGPSIMYAAHALEALEQFLDAKK